MEGTVWMGWRELWGKGESVCVCEGIGYVCESVCVCVCVCEWILQGGREVEGLVRE